MQEGEDGERIRFEPNGTRHTASTFERILSHASFHLCIVSGADWHQSIITAAMHGQMGTPW